MINQLPISLKNEVIRDMNVRILNNKKIFSLNFSKNFITELAQVLKEKKLGPEEILYA